MIRPLVEPKDVKDKIEDIFKRAGTYEREPNLRTDASGGRSRSAAGARS